VATGHSLSTAEKLKKLKKWSWSIFKNSKNHNLNNFIIKGKNGAEYV